MRKILVIILLAVSLFNLGKKSDFVLDDAFFLQVIEQYDTDISLSQYRFRIYEKSPNTENSNPFYDYDYEIIGSANLAGPFYSVRVLRRCPTNPSFAPPIYIDFLLEIKSETSYRYLSVTNAENCGSMTAEDVIITAAKTYDQALTGHRFLNESDSDYYVKYLQYACIPELEKMYSTAELRQIFDYGEKTYRVPAQTVERILHDRFPGNAVCDSGYYDKSTDSYVFPIGVYESFYDLKITKYEKIAHNMYRAEIEKTHSLTDKIDPVKISMILEISGDSYRYLTVKYG